MLGLTSFRNHAGSASGLGAWQWLMWDSRKGRQQEQSTRRSLLEPCTPLFLLLNSVPHAQEFHPSGLPLGWLVGGTVTVRVPRRCCGVGHHRHLQRWTTACPLACYSQRCITTAANGLQVCHGTRRSIAAPCQQ